MAQNPGGQAERGINVIQITFQGAQGQHRKGLPALAGQPKGMKGATQGHLLNFPAPMAKPRGSAILGERGALGGHPIIPQPQWQNQEGPRS